MNRSDIVQSAAQIFRQKGYHATSMQDIANAVGLQKASLYHHVTGKQEILAAILDAALDRLIGELQAVVDSDLPPEAKLKAAMESYIGRLTGEADLAAVLLLEHRSLEPPLRERHIERRDRFDRLWRDILHQGIQSGAFRPVDETITAFAVLGVQNWLITWYRSSGRLPPSRLAHQFADVFLKGLLADGHTKSREA
ncbi:MAG TPA: TetR/AcrR family transcriptional regulator [Anaerolineales bacterium]|nr:TetR/AcrR family transcriptional regulator [Anaerolineales bacterium]